MPRRDPETGKFVSGSGGRPSSNFDRWETLSGGLAVQIPAADNAGGSTIEQWTGSNGIVVDFEGELDNDELFRLQSFELSTSLALPTTATAEGSAVVGYVVGSDMINPQPLATRPTALGPLPGVDDEEGVLDIARAQLDDDNVLMTGVLHAEAGHSDTVNGIAAGADTANQARSWSPWKDFGRTVDFDESDEIAITGELSSRNVSDHQVIATFYVTVHGWIDEFD